jgi:hypothetical protein
VQESGHSLTYSSITAYACMNQQSCENPQSEQPVYQPIFETDTVRIQAGSFGASGKLFSKMMKNGEQ